MKAGNFIETDKQMKQVTHNRLLIVTAMWMVGFILAAALFSGSLLAQPLDPTPTPNADGVIIVIVQVGDTLWSVAAHAGLTLEELLELNDLTRDSFIQPGQELIIGYAEGSAPPSGTVMATLEVTSVVTAAASPTITVTSTPAPSATPQPTPETVIGPATGGSICLKAFDDTNQNGLHDVGEPVRPAVAFTITNADTQSVTSNYITDANTDTYCVDDLVAGSYLITRSKTDNEKMTTPDNWAVAIVDGTTMTLAFGSYLDTSSPTPVAEAEEAGVTDAAANSLTEVDPSVEEGSSRVITVIVVVAVILAALLLIGVLVVILSARRSTV